MRVWFNIIMVIGQEVLASTLRGQPMLNTEVGVSKHSGDDYDLKHRHKVLCSKRVLSHVSYCPEGVQSEAAEAPRTTGKLYPIKEAWEKAVKEGHACQLPAPFMVEDPAGKCCIPRGGEKNVWPNFCHNRAKYIGKAKHSDYVQELDLMGSQPGHVPAGVFVLGRPDLPLNYDSFHTSYLMMGMYVLLTMMCLSFAVYVVQRLNDEDAIVKGKQREGKLFNAKQPGFNFAELTEEEGSDEEEELDEDSESSVSPAHRTIARDEAQVAASVDQVSMSFGLLPALPRGRSTANSALNSPRLTARDRRD